MHIEFGIKAPEEFDPTTNYFYVIRRHDHPIDLYDTLDDCFSEMPFKVLFGTTRGSMIHNLKMIIEKIFEPAVELQFRVPKIHSGAEGHEKDIEQPQLPNEPSGVGAGGDDGDDEPCGPILMDFSRPSDFRFVAVKAKKIGYNATGNDSHLGQRERRPSMSLTPSERTTSDMAVTSSRVDTTISEYSTNTQAIVKESVSERWERLLKLVTEKTEQDRVKMMEKETGKSAIKDNLQKNLDKFLSRIDW